jgi:G3E family GTPase
MIIPCLFHVSDSIILLSGLADPGPIASIFWMDDELGSDIYLDGIVTLVDAKYISEVNYLATYAL